MSTRPKEYPQTITLDELERNAHVSDAVVARDIAETEHELFCLHETQKAYGIIAKYELSPMERERATMRERVHPQEIRDREAFCAYLRRLQVARRELHTV